jgi:multidrug efflux pump subunit AcrA (membrane-fusion protein)
MPFSERQAPFFFGRDGEREIVTANLLASRLTVLYGPSGVGKSSLLNAGVAYHLRQLAQLNLKERGTPEFAVIVFRSWRDDPLRELVSAVRKQLDDPLSRSVEQTLDSVTARLNCDLLIILDQFEEYFLYHGNGDGDGGFARAFARAINQGDRRTSFLLSIREDSLAKLDQFDAPIPGIFENRIRVDHLDRDAARDAIRKPLDKFNAGRSNGRPPVTIEPALVEQVIQQVSTGRMIRGRAAHCVADRPTGPAVGERVETPYLQLVMTRLWDEEQGAGSQVLRAATLDRLGGAEKIVSTHLDEAMSSLTPPEMEAAARVFNHLVTPSRTKIAHSVPDLANYAGVTPEALVPLLQKLSTGQNRILTPVAPAPDQPAHLRYQILHDVLAASVLDWRARYMRRRDRAEAEARAEEQRLRADQEAKARGRLRKLSVLLSAMVIVATGLAALAGSQMRKAEDRRAEAEAARLEAEAAQHIAQAGRLDLEAANKARDAAERLAELKRLEAEAAKAELQGALAQARRFRERAAETKQQVDTEQAASVTLGREAQQERRSAATSQSKIERLRKGAVNVPDETGVRDALQRYQEAYRSFDFDALTAVYPALPADRRKHLRQWRDACKEYEVKLTDLHVIPTSATSVTVESQTLYRCVPKPGRQPSDSWGMKETLWLRKSTNGSWIIENVTAPRGR